ncbi:hypothetical protein GCM10010121_039050 [Streptomyces brasiliensis]|uniref:Uncharacterized protein n=1 Tax=Streptomyces brasiliensis TaxID=1954 RepID=A0A917KTP2_9ACTN|nr:hypothetical protein GCM10010121_039050 [Streptomyces brasiliensis]
MECGHTARATYRLAAGKGGTTQEFGNLISRLAAEAGYDMTPGAGGRRAWAAPRNPIRGREAVVIAVPSWRESSA